MHGVSWRDSTLYLFREEYHVPLLPPALAAVTGAAGEIVFPILLAAGLLTRYAALGLSAVNVVAVVSYAHVLQSEGFEAALGQHYLWGSLLRRASGDRARALVAGRIPAASRVLTAIGT